jgi:tetratricopeptide (TPR) repeat protein
MDHSLPIHLRLCLGALPRPTRYLVEHLLQCPACRGAAAPLLATAAAPEEPPSSLSPYDRAFERSEGRVREHRARLAAERAAVGARLEPLLAGEPEHRWVERAEADPDLLSPVAVETLLARGTQLVIEAPETSAAFARFALELAERIPPGLASRDYVLLLRVRAWGLLGLAFSQTSGWKNASLPFEHASRLVAEHTQTDEEAELLTRLASASLRDGRAPEALACFARAARIYDALGESRREAHCLRHLGLLHFDRGDLDTAAGSLAEALILAEADGDEELASVLRHDLAWVLLAGDDPRGAREVLGKATPLRDRPELPALLLLLLRSEALAERLRQDLAQAQGRGDDFQAAVHLLLLARCYVRRERASDQGSLAAQARALSASPQLAPATRAALGKLADALERGEATVALIVTIARSLRFADLADPDASVH